MMFRLGQCKILMSFCAKFVSSFRRPLCYAAVRLKGHSKWQNIKDNKGKNDLLKSKKINFLLERVRIAVKKGGFDLKFNKDLVSVQQEFRANSLPLDTFNSYLLKLKAKPESTIHFEIIGPAGSLFIVETVTDSKSKKMNTMSKYFNKTGGFRLSSGSIKQAFDEKGILQVSPMKDDKLTPLEKMEELGIELDCEEVSLIADEADEKYYEFVCDYTNMFKVEKALKDLGYSVSTAELQLRAKNTVAIGVEDTAKVEKFYQFLHEDPDVKQVFDNLEPLAA